MRKRLWYPLGAFALAVLVIGAGIAHAAEFKAGKYPATVTGIQGGPKAPPPEGDTGSTWVMGFENSLMLSCLEGKFQGKLESPAANLSTAVSLSGCTFYKFAATVTMNGCELDFNAGAGSEDEYTGSLGIACPGESKILVAVNIPFLAVCEVEIGSQSGGGSISYVNLTEESPTGFTAGFETHSLAYTKTKSTGLCPLAGTGSKTDGVIVGGATFTSGNGIWIE